EASRVSLGVSLASAGVLLRSRGHPVVMMAKFVDENVYQLKRVSGIFGELQLPAIYFSDARDFQFFEDLLVLEIPVVVNIVQGNSSFPRTECDEAGSVPAHIPVIPRGEEDNVQAH